MQNTYAYYAYAACDNLAANLIVSFIIIAALTHRQREGEREREIETARGRGRETATFRGEIAWVAFILGKVLRHSRVLWEINKSI